MDARKSVIFAFQYAKVYENKPLQNVFKRI